MLEIYAYNVPHALREACWKLRSYHIEQPSRNGPVWRAAAPTFLTISNPLERVLFDPIRDANPFFHVMEFCWMIAGSNDIQWIAQFNKRMLEYSDDGKTQHAAYGNRWVHHWGDDQIYEAIDLLKKNKEDRRVVLQMWDPTADLGHTGKDVPCNTQIMLDASLNRLDFLVTNRSNDLIWGMLGANAVHMTMLQELISNAVGIPTGTYRVVSNNLHIYKNVPNFDYYMNSALPVYDRYHKARWGHIPLLQHNESYLDFAKDCENLVDGSAKTYTFWMRHVGRPIYDAWFDRKNGRGVDLMAIGADDWGVACAEWISRRATVGNQCDNNNASMDGGEQTSPCMGAGSGESSPVADVDSSKPDVGASST